MKENKDYKLVDSSESEQYAIEILTSDFAGVIFRYNGIQVSEDGDHLILKYDFTIEKSNELYTNIELENDEDFLNIIGKILENLLTESAFNIESKNAQH